jgi:hypothetical protein
MEGVADVPISVIGSIVTGQRRARAAAAKALTVPELPPDTRPKRPVASWSGRHYVRRR